MASKYNITVECGVYGELVSIPEYDQVRVARAIVALDNAERKFERLIAQIDYNRYG